MPWWQTILLGVVGSHVGGLIAGVLPGGRPITDIGPSNIVLSVIGAVIALLVFRRVRSNS
jgi:uncharacterized membrane protein YeaQ/YmgE (transglycosylase-associated protein family)